MSWHQCFYHVIWATKHRTPCLRADDAGQIEAVIRTSSREHGVIVHAVGMVADHIHVAASIPPSLAVSEMVRRWKGRSSHLINSHRLPDTATFAWQQGYGVLTFGRKSLPDVVAYVLNQEARHRSGDLWAGLERTECRRAGAGGCATGEPRSCSAPTGALLA